MTSTQERNTDSRAFDHDCILPKVSIFENKEGYVLQAEMPGVNRNGLEITLEGSELTIAGRRADESVKATLLYRESRPANYRRVFELDPVIDTRRIEAKIEQGMLTVHLPRQERVRPHKITISE